jgi:signal transduction histidine kinase
LLLDENEIRQLLLNLVRNSIEAMPAGGNLVIRTFQEDSKVVLSVSDQGAGIPANILDKLGTPFITTKDTGTGLGLPICYQIAHRHNANIEINTSTEGTTFFVYFSSLLP